MNPGDRAEAVRLEIGDWQKRHGLSDQDPLMAVVEVVELLFGSLDKGAVCHSQKILQELCESVELLNQRSNALSKQIGALAASARSQEEWESKSNGGLSLLLGALLFGAGIVLGRWWG
jgi:hypothetical protein